MSETPTFRLPIKITILFIFPEDDQETGQTTIFQAPFATKKLHEVETWFSQDVSEKPSEPFIQLMLQFQKENCKLIGMNFFFFI